MKGMEDLEEKAILFFEQTTLFLDHVKKVVEHHRGFFSTFACSMEAIGDLTAVTITGKGYIADEQRFWKPGITIVVSPSVFVQKIREMLLDDRPGFRIQSFKDGMADTRIWKEPSEDAQSTVIKGLETAFCLEVVLEPRISK